MEQTHPRGDRAPEGGPAGGRKALAGSRGGSLKIKIIPRLGIGPRGQLQVVIDVPYELKDWFKERLDWKRCEYRWDREYKVWLVNLDEIKYVAGRLGIPIPQSILEILEE